MVSVTVQGIKIPVSFDLGGSRLQLALSRAILRQHHLQVNYPGKVVPGVDARGVKSISRELHKARDELEYLKRNFLDCGRLQAKTSISGEML
jgi:hypothetical protein